MAIDVTVLGASGTTVTIPFTSATSAAAAQAALLGITQQVLGGTLTQVNYAGGGTVPSAGTPKVGVVATSSSPAELPTFAIGGSTVSAVLGGASDQAVIVNFGVNGAIVASGSGGSTASITGGAQTVVSGTGGAEIGNLGQNTQVFLGGASIENFAELGLGLFGAPVNPSATVWLTTSDKGTANFDDSSGTTAINLDTVAGSRIFGQTLVINNNGNGQTTVNMAANTSGAAVDGDVISFRGSGTLAGSTTVNAAGGADGLGHATGGVGLWALLKSGNAFINGNGSNVVVFPTGTGVSATLFGGSGSDIVIGAAGFYTAGSGGNSVLYGSAVSGSTTLVGGATNDQMVGQHAGTQLIAGSGGEFLFATTSGETLSGDPNAQAPGNQTLLDGTTGGQTFITGNASDGSVAGAGGSNIFSTNDSNGANLFKEGVQNLGAGGDANSATINGFVSGSDSISLSNPAGGNYSLIGASTIAPAAGQVDFQVAGGNTQVNFGDGTTWTIMGVTLTANDFHTS